MGHTGYSPRPRAQRPLHPLDMLLEDKKKEKKREKKTEKETHKKERKEERADDL